MRLDVTTETKRKTEVPTSVTIHFGSTIIGACGWVRRIFNSAERRAYLEDKWRAEDRVNLLKRADMNQYQFNTGVVVSTDSTSNYPNKPPLDFRIAVNSAISNDWGDCIAIGFYDPTVKGWRYGHFSPARARLIAQNLVDRAEYLEKEEPSSVDIDRDDENAKQEAAAAP